MTLDRIIHRLYAAYSSLPFALLFPPLLLGILYFDDFLGHLCALLALSVFLMIEIKSRLIRLLLLITLPVVALSYLFGSNAYPMMFGWLVACGIRVARAR